MYLGQMSEQLEAISYFQQGVNLMIAERAAMPQDLTKGSEYLMLSSKISSALCSMTDIYLTDCWYVTLLHTSFQFRHDNGIIGFRDTRAATKEA